MPASRCLVRGSINIDEFFHLPHIVRPGETISSTDFARKPGGKGANQSYAVAKAGGQVDLDGCIGQDGTWVKEYLEAGGVDVHRLQVLKDEVTGRAIIQILHKGANFYAPSEPQQLDLSSYTHLLLQNEIPLPITLEHLTTAASHSITTVFNPSPMLSTSELRSFPWDSLSWLIVNEGELADLLSALGSSTSRPSSSEGENLRGKAEEDLRLLHENQHFSSSTSIICTLGAQGIIYFQPRSNLPVNMGHLPAAKLQKPVKDTTGAGDCFAGYFVAGLMAGLELEEVLRICLTACAICVESAGAMESYASRDEVLKRLN
ncbi:ATP binding protein [Kockovaella imperatae]|uniref:Ribokinase n=1 Tax=Kockovaella imperatae TaxID=4999 RepID=A0A1Y1UID8_9TREE|nr:ATP binding protein [Kockovaella imperatae]ORX37823.1 ATP binding protein [Kockovaella imperatae]